MAWSSCKPRRCAMSFGKEDQEYKNDETSSASTSSGEQSHSGASYVDVIVTCVRSTNNVHFRFADYNADFIKLTEMMTRCYGNGYVTDVAAELKEGRIYATLSENGWARVELVARQGDGKAECCFVDEGTTEVLEETALLHLVDEFMVLPKQAIQCELSGLEKYATSKDVAEILSDVLLDKSLTAQVLSRKDPITVVMFDTSGPEDVDLNREIFQRLITPRLPAKGCLANAVLSYVGQDGIVWLQPNELGMRELNDFSAALDQYCQSHPAMVEDPVMDKMYACHYRADGKFYRAVLLSPDPRPSGEFEVLFVDYGNKEKVFLTEFRDIDCLGDLVVRLPSQALKVRLRKPTGAGGVTWPDETARKLRNVGAANMELVVKVCEPASGLEPALVELYKWHEHYQDLLSVNPTLLDALRS